MTELKKDTSERSSKDSVTDININVSEDSSELLSFLSKLDPNYDKDRLLSGGSEFEQHSSNLLNEIKLFHSKIENIPLITFVSLWAQNVEKDRLFGVRYLKMMNQMMRIPLLIYRTDDDKTLNLKEFIYGEYYKDVLDYIRCFEGLSIEAREDFVSFYLYFIGWLSRETVGYFNRLEDHDRIVTIKRKVPFDDYIKVISRLAIRERLIAKLLYLGGNRTIEEVISLKIEDVAQLEGVINFSGEKVKYSFHVFIDLVEYIQERKSGHVFIGLHGDRLDQTVPYRVLKNVLSKMSMFETFSFKSFLDNV